MRPRTDDGREIPQQATGGNRPPKESTDIGQFPPPPHSPRPHSKQADAAKRRPAPQGEPTDIGQFPPAVRRTDWLPHEIHHHTARAHAAKRWPTKGVGATTPHPQARPRHPEGDGRAMGPRDKTDISRIPPQHPREGQRRSEAMAGPTQGVGAPTPNPREPTNTSQLPPHKAITHTTTPKGTNTTTPKGTRGKTRDQPPPQTRGT